MKNYEVVIRATITKTYVVKAESEAEATATAHDIFSVLNDGTDEDYDQDVVSVQIAEEAEEGEWK
jgi:hypothetical protein